jgi:ATP-dependent Lhr-like helicase
LRDIQTRAIHVIRDSQADVIVAASTAGGKTEAAFLPLISEVLEEDVGGSGGFDLLYIAPLKALITDQANRLEAICQEAELPVVPWHGDVAASIKTRATKRPRGILLITPESLEALFIRRGLDVPRLFRSVRAVILDEVHTMLDSERGVQLRSLLTRLELAIGRPVRRIGLSATLGDMAQACIYLRPDDAANVQVIEAAGGEAELRLQLRGYLAGGTDKSIPAPTELIAKHIFDHLRGTDNLVFAGSRQSVEIYADRLRTMCEDARLPQEFYPHHASLSRDHRDLVERRLKDGKLPTTAICTSTLELGIDIGDVSCVAQIGAPFSVASLRQRLGRSGRRAGKPAILRQYAVEAARLEKQLCGQAPARPHPVNRHDRIATRKMVRACAIWGFAPFDSGASDIVDHCRKRWRPCPSALSCALSGRTVPPGQFGHFCRCLARHGAGRSRSD